MLNTFSYGGINSATFGITYDTEFHSILPEQRRYIKEVTGMDGVIDYGIGGYGVRIIVLKLYFNGDFEVLRTNRENIIAWLASTNGEAKQLIFDNEPTKYYMAKIYSAISFDIDSQSRELGSITIECNPPWQYENGILLTPSEIAWVNADYVEGNQYVKELNSTSGNTLRITNTGTVDTKPIIKLIGFIPAGFRISVPYGVGLLSMEFSAETRNDGIIIDCQNETVTRMSDGTNLFDIIVDDTDYYAIIQPGNVEITFGGASTINDYPSSCLVIVELNPQNLG